MSDIAVEPIEQKPAIAVNLFTTRTHTKTTLNLKLDFFGVRNDLLDMALVNNVSNLGRYIAQLLQNESNSVLEASMADAIKYSEIAQPAVLARSSYKVDQEEFDEREFQVMHGTAAQPKDQLKN